MMIMVVFAYVVLFSFIQAHYIASNFYHISFQLHDHDGVDVYAYNDDMMMMMNGMLVH